MHRTSFRALRNFETLRESGVLRSFKHFGASEHAASLASYAVSNTEEHRNTPRIMHSNTFRILWSIETCRVPRIVGGFKHFGALEHGANLALYEVSNTGRLEKRRGSHILRGFENYGDLKLAANHASYKVPSTLEP